MLFQIADYAAAGYAVDELKRSRRRQHRICDDVQMIQHDHIGIQGKPARPARLIKGRAGNKLDLIAAKNRQAISGDRGQVVTRRVAGDDMHTLIVDKRSMK